MLHALIIAALVLYLLSGGIALFSIPWNKPRLFRLGGNLLPLALVFHSGGLFAYLLEEHGTFHRFGADYYLWLSWVVSMSYLFIGRRLSSPVVAALTALASALFLVSSSYLAHRISDTPTLNIRADAVLLGVHVLPALLAELSLVLAFCVSIAFLMQDGRLKRKELRGLELKGPSLGTLAALSQRLIMIGFLAMSVAVLSGVLWAVSHQQPLLRSDTIQWSAVFSWLLLGFILYSRLNLGWSPKRISRLTVLFVSVLFSLTLLFLFLTGSVPHAEYL